MHGKRQWPCRHKKTKFNDQLNHIKQILQIWHLLDFPCLKFIDGIKHGAIFFVKCVFMSCQIANGCKHSSQHEAICDERRSCDERRISAGTRGCTRHVKCKSPHFHEKAHPGANAFFVVCK
jgi:hypothetical protein